MRLTCTAIIGIDTCFEVGGTQSAVRFRYRTLPMDPFRFHRIEPWTFARHVADEEAHALSTSLAPLIMLAYPVPHGLATGPRDVIPDQQHRREALGAELCRAPGQQLDGDRTHGAPGHKPAPHLPGLLRRRPHQQAI